MAYTSRTDFPSQLPAKRAFLCWSCKQPGVEQVVMGGRKCYHCNQCGQTNERFLAYDPGMAAYFDDNGRLIHESAGLLLMGQAGKLLLFKRTKFPYLLTIPAGHLEAGEDPRLAAIREASEEIGIDIADVLPAFEGLIEGDACVGGADIHHWHAYVAVLPADAAPKLAGEEGSEWGWYDPATLSGDDTVQPLLYLLQQSGIQAAMQSVI